MYKPSGIAIVTAGLAALALFHVVWGRDTRHAEPLLQHDAPTHSAAFDPGTAFLLHSGAWRAWPAPVEEEPATLPVALPAPADIATQAANPRDQIPPMQRSGEGEPSRASPAVPARVTTYAEPAATPAAEAPTPTPPPAEGRMSLAGPGVEAASPPAAQAGRWAPRTHDRASEVATPAPTESKFGPAIFKQIERNGF
jgi:hypothetical protein